MRSRCLLLGIGLILLLSLFTPNPVLSDWWNQSFSYRREINLSNTAGNLTDYQVKIIKNFSTEYTNGKINKTCKDLRFTNSTDDELGYWLEECQLNETDNATAWVNVTSIPNNTNTTIYMYYGNPSVSSTSSIDNTFIREIDGTQPVRGSWRMNEGSGTTAYDTSGNANDGTINGGETWVDGKIKKALDFDGVDDNVDCGNDTSLDLTDSLSISVWFYQKGESGDTYPRLVAKGQNEQYEIFLLEDTRDDGAFRIEEGGSNYDAGRSDFTWNLNEWHHIVGTYNGSLGKLYFDGVEQPTTVSPSAPLDSVSDNVTIGDWNTLGERRFNGTIDELQIYDRALTAEEVSDLYNNYGYTTTNYPGRSLVTKYEEPEPTSTIGSEEAIHFTVTLNSPPNQTATTDTTPDFNFTVSGSEDYYSCELFINDSGYGTSEKWYSDSDIISGLGDIGDDSAPTVYQKDSTWHLISGEDGGVFHGYQWNGTDWVSNSSVVSGLGDVGYDSEPTVYQKDSTWHLISGEYNGVFYGFQWNGTDWVSNSSIVSGLGDIGDDSAPTVYQKDSTWHLISGEDGGVFHGFQWNALNNTATIITANSTLSDGAYNWYINCSADSTTNSSETREITIDTTNPEISYNPNTDESGTYDKDWIFINVTASDINKDSVKLNWNGTNETFDNQSGDVYWENKTSLADGNYTFYASINDTAGNENQTEEREVKITEWTISVYETDNSSDKSWNINDIPLNFQYYCYAGVDGSCNSSLADDGDGSTCNFTIENNGSSTVDVLMYALGDYSSSYYICSSSDSTTDGDDSGCQDPPATGDNGADNIQIYNSSAWFNISSKIHDGDAYGMAIACDLPANTNLSDIDFQVRVPDGVAPSSYSATLQFVAYSDISDCSVGSYFVP